MIYIVLKISLTGQILVKRQVEQLIDAGKEDTSSRLLLSRSLPEICLFRLLT